jgi:hypothetical protein
MGIEMEDLLDQMSLAALAERCQREISNFRKGMPYDDRYCLEIFHRAITRNDEQAWELLVRSFRRMMKGWLRSHPKRESAMRYDTEDNYVDYAFTRLWQATHHQGLVFDSLAAALRYLKLSLHGAILDTLRAHARPVLPWPEPETGFPEELAAGDHDDGMELWAVIESLLPAAREKRVAYLIIHCGLKPREVVSRCPGLFSDVKEVYRVYRNILERLTRNADQIRWRLSDQEL